MSDLQYTLDHLARHLGARLIGDADYSIYGLATLADAGVGQLSFLANSRYRSQLAESRAGAVLIRESDAELWQGNALVVKDPYVAYARVAQLLDPTPIMAPQIAASAVIADDVELGQGVAIGERVVIEAGARIGAGVQIGHGCVIGQGASIGADTRLWANVTVYHGVQIGAQCLLHSGAVIGADGFGFANEAGNWIKIPQTGGVVIGDGSEIGANTCIDRGALADTVIGKNVIIDNQCQIAHNVTIGDHTAMAGTTVVAGSVSIGKYCIIGGACAINGHISICDQTHITGMSMVTKSITEPGVWSSGTPAQPNRQWRKSAARFRQLDEMHQRVRQLESKLEQLDSTVA